MVNLRTITVASAASVLVLSSLVGCSSSGDKTPATKTKTLTINNVIFGETSTEDSRAQDQRIQELIAQCMTEKGWEYIPVTYPDEWYEFEDYNPEDERKRVEREGLGIVYYLLNGNQVDNIPVDPVDPGFVDPNTAIYEALSPQEQEAYSKDLWGDMTVMPMPEPRPFDGEAAEDSASAEPADVSSDADVTIDEPIIDDSWIGFGGGCQGEASEEVYGEQNQVNEDVWAELDQFYSDLYEKTEADPRIIALVDNYSKCMAKEDYDFETVNDFYEKGYEVINTRLFEIVGEDFYNYDPFEGWTDEQINNFYENATDQELNDLWDYSKRISPEQRPELEALMKDEIKLAVANYDCSTDYNNKYTEISSQIEEDFVNANRAQLDAIAAKANGSSK